VPRLRTEEVELTALFSGIRTDSYQDSLVGSGGSGSVMGMGVVGSLTGAAGSSSGGIGTGFGAGEGSGSIGS
jgi:hypothetical protein